MYPKYAVIGGKKYKINSDYRVALDCFKAINDDEIDDIQRAYAVVGLLFGIDIPDKYINEALDKAKIFLNCGKEIEENVTDADMDYVQDYDYIISSFFYTYKVSLDSYKYMHWWKFFSLMCGFDEKCILNKVREIRNYDVSKITDEKEKEKIIEAKRKLALKNKISKEEQQEIDEFNSLFD